MDWYEAITVCGSQSLFLSNHILFRRYTVQFALPGPAESILIEESNVSSPSMDLDAEPVSLQEEEETFNHIIQEMPQRQQKSVYLFDELGSWNNVGRRLLSREIASPVHGPHMGPRTCYRPVAMLQLVPPSTKVGC